MRLGVISVIAVCSFVFAAALSCGFETGFSLLM